MRIDELYEVWQELYSSGVQGSYREYDSTHPVRILFGTNTDGNYEFFVTSHVPVKWGDYVTDSIEVLGGKRADGDHSIVFRLTDHRYRDIFIHLCWDLSESSRDSNANYSGVLHMLKRFLLWQKLFSRRPDEHMGMQALKGLLGELFFIDTCLSCSFPKKEVIEGWQGPYGYPQDFCLSHYWYEVKTTEPNAKKIEISSIDQLDCELEGRIVWIIAEKASILGEGVTTVPRLIRRIESFLEFSHDLIDRFRTSLVKYGYISDEFYESVGFHIRQMTFFKVDSDFPALRRSSIPKAVISATYNIDITRIEEFLLVGGEDDISRIP